MKKILKISFFVIVMFIYGAKAAGTNEETIFLNDLKITSLMRAVANNDVKAAKIFLDNGSSVNEKNIAMANTVEYYLSKGFDRKAAEYFAGGRKRIVAVVPNDDFTLTISFDNGERRLYDMRPLLRKGTVFEPLINPDAFRRAYVDNTHCIAWDIDPNVDSEKVWSNKIDLSPDGCYIDSKPIGGALGA